MLVCATYRALLHTRPRVQQAPGIPCALLIFSGAKDEQDSGETRRENADPYSLVITRLDRVIQYPRGGHD